MVYLYELAASRHKGVVGSIGYVSLGAGVVAGILVVTAVISCLGEDALLAWGWRVPFLLAAVSLLAGVALRYNMPESVEFAANHEAMDEDYRRRAAAAALQRAHHRHSGQGHGDGHGAAANAAAHHAPDAPAEDDEAAEAAAAEAAVAARHYVPLLELFRGYWSGLVLHVTYAACELARGAACGAAWSARARARARLSLTRPRLPAAGAAACAPASTRGQGTRRPSTSATPGCRPSSWPRSASRRA